MLSYLIMILVMLSFLIIFSAPSPYSREVPHAIVPYSEEHVPLYEMVTYHPPRYHAELTYLQSRMSTSSHVLDVGSGLGYHVNALNENGISAVGLDSSKAMVRHSKETYPCSFVHGNVLNTSLFPEHAFTHILCLYYTFYTIHDKETFFRNAHHWLVEDGMLYLHGSTECRFGDPMVGEITYESSLHHTMMKEKITQSGKTYIIHHVVYYMTKEETIQLAKRCHFRYVHEHVYGNHSIFSFQRITPIFDNME